VLAEQGTKRSKKARTVRQSAFFCFNVSRYSARLAFNFYLQVFSQIILKAPPPQISKLCKPTEMTSATVSKKSERITIFFNRREQQLQKGLVRK
jgi:hypothetical protein